MDHEHNPFQCNLGYQVSLSGKNQWEKADKQVIVVANFNYIEKAPEGSWGNNQSSSGSTLTEDIPF